MCFASGSGCGMTSQMFHCLKKMFNINQFLVKVAFHSSKCKILNCVFRIRTIKNTKRTRLSCIYTYAHTHIHKHTPRNTHKFQFVVLKHFNVITMYVQCETLLFCKEQYISYINPLQEIEKSNV